MRTPLVVGNWKMHGTLAETRALTTALRDGLKRPGRLGWLGDRRTSTESWDAYEALDGRSLVTLLDRPQPWRAVRTWLADLAQEIASSPNLALLSGPMRAKAQEMINTG